MTPATFSPHLRFIGSSECRRTRRTNKKSRLLSLTLLATSSKRLAQVKALMPPNHRRLRRPRSMYRVSDHRWAAFLIFDIDCKQRSPVTIAFRRVQALSKRATGILGVSNYLLGSRPIIRDTQINNCFGIPHLLYYMGICSYVDGAPSLAGSVACSSITK